MEEERRYSTLACITFHFISSLSFSTVLLFLLLFYLKIIDDRGMDRCTYIYAECKRQGFRSLSQCTIYRTKDNDDHISLTLSSCTCM